MENELKVYDRDEILAGFSRQWDDVESYFQAINPENISSQDGKWSALDEFEHVIKSNQAVVSGLKMPKMFFMTFGKPNRPVRTYGETYQRYLERLEENRGMTPPSQFAPGKVAATWDALLEHWSVMGPKYQQRIQKWSEKDLDGYLIPHPLLGKIMAREMLFFTHFHNLHHFNSIKSKLNS